MTGITASDEKQNTTTEQPTTPYVFVQPTMEKLKAAGLSRKHVLIAGTCLAVTVLVVTCVLVAIRVYTDSNMEMLKYEMTMKDRDNNSVSQDVSADVDANIVKYHIVKDGIETWIIQDFDKDIQVSKVVTDSSVGCYVNHLNRSLASDPGAIPSATPKTDSNTPSVQLVYKVSENPISDISFLGRRPAKMCENIPTYWMEPSCEGGASPDDANNGTSAGGGAERRKRASFCTYCGGYHCSCGCCGLVCGRFATYSYYWYFSNGYYVCVYQMYYVSCNINLRPYGCRYGGRNWYYP